MAVKSLLLVFFSVLRSFAALRDSDAERHDRLRQVRMVLKNAFPAINNSVFTRSVLVTFAFSSFSPKHVKQKKPSSPVKKSVSFFSKTGE